MSLLPDNILRRMNPEDRKPLGKAGVTSEEALLKREQTEERELHKDILQYLHHVGVKYVRHCRFGKKPTEDTPGHPDFQFFWRGIGAAVEAKVGKNTLSADQEIRRRELIEDGCRYCVARNVPDVQTFLRDEIKFPRRDCGKCNGAGSFADGDRCGMCGGAGKER